MSTAQQLGLIGNSIKVQSLPTASAETFGAGNRYYTLIGQQEGYITGHTYHTIVANDVYSWEDVAQAGPQGEDGLPALVFNDMWGFINVGLFNASTESFNRTPIVGEKVVIFSTENQYALATIESVSETTVGVRFSGPIIYTKGATGSQGPAGTTVYNNLSDIPVINQDLSASGFTPVANTYYRHTGSTTATFTQGVIYLYDTAYHKLGESGGGTTLNQYTYTANLSSPSFAIRNTINLIAKNAARYNASMEIRAKLSDGKSVILYGAVLLNSSYYGYNGVLYSTTNYISPIYVEDGGSQIKVIGCCIKNGAISSFTETSSIKLTIDYYNDTEITA